jgi:predicted transcriptional regulator of viral defense system
MSNADAGNNMQRRYIIASGDMVQRRLWDTTLYELAEDQAGYFTAAQARAAGLPQVRLAQLYKRGDVERVSRGVYRLTRYPVSPLGQYMAAALWPQVRRPDVQAVVSHESALAIYGLSNASPAKVHVTVPAQLRIRRAAPPHVVLHHAHLDPKDVQRVEGVPVTVPARAIRDVHADHLGSALVRQAIADGRRTGHLTLDEADVLERELLGTKRHRRRNPHKMAHGGSHA